ncbi:MAG: type II toxin-antitoxin system VapC family toxin [Conexibacter sp.]
MRLLLDSHVLLWLAADDPALAPETSAAIYSGENEVLVSVASVWEIEIKRAKGALQTPDGLGPRLNQAGFELLDIELSHVVRAAELPPHHRDPFDRMLVAQAIGERAVLVTADEALRAYDVPLMPARAA